jgi:hypothetical protein
MSIHRGRLQQRFIAKIRRLDTASTAAVSGGGFDDVFGEPLPVDDGSQLGASSRREFVADEIPCQLDRTPEWGAFRPTRAGKMQTDSITITLHMIDVENGGFRGADGLPVFKRGDRIESILQTDGTVAWTFANPPGLFIDKVQPAGYGLHTFGVSKINLVDLICTPSDQGSVQ